jgi:hypothetical protein
MLSRSKHEPLESSCVTLSSSKGVARNARCLSSSKAARHARLDELGETKARFDKLSVTGASTSSA